MNVTDFATLYLHKCSFMDTLNVPGHIYATFSIIIICSHDNPIKKYSQCKVDFSFSHMGQCDYILLYIAYVKIGI